MKPVIGINMSYDEYRRHIREDVPRYRDAYKLYVSYADAVQESGGIALLLPPFADPGSLDDYLDMVHGFLFTGGDDYPSSLYHEVQHPKTKAIHPRRVQADIYCARKILLTRKPVFAICGGIQLVSIVSGGKLVQHLHNLSMHNKKSTLRDSAHTVSLARDSLLYSLFKRDEIEVNSAHHQAVDGRYPGTNLRVTATASDGTVEALEPSDSGDRFLLAVQWHPERIGDKVHKRLLFDGFIDAARAHSS
jgi:putative glutamine amidotransferase